MNRALRFLVAILWVALVASAWARPEALLRQVPQSKCATKTRGPTAADSDGTVAKVTTQVYTGVTINDLRAMHRKFHPREQEPRPASERKSPLTERIGCNYNVAT